MIHELYTDLTNPGCSLEMTRRLQSEGFSIRSATAAQHGGRLLGAWLAEFGALNRLYHLWEFQSSEELAQFNKALRANRQWIDFAKSVNTLTVGGETMHLSPQFAIAAQPDAVVYDLRLYDVRPYMAEQYVKLISEVMPVRLKYSAYYCVWVPLSGYVHRIVHLWPYKSLEQRAKTRLGVASEPQWQKFVASVYPLLLKQTSSLLVPIATE